MPTSLAAPILPVDGRGDGGSILSLCNFYPNGIMATNKKRMQAVSCSESGPHSVCLFKIAQTWLGDTPCISTSVS